VGQGTVREMILTLKGFQPVRDRSVMWHLTMRGQHDTSRKDTCQTLSWEGLESSSPGQTALVDPGMRA
jgi:hypothetical protein